MDTTLTIFIIFASLAVLAVILYFTRRWLDGGRCHSDANLHGKTVLITGANSGIGKETAVDLARRGATIVLACRNQQRGEDALYEIKERSGSDNVYLRLLDLASLESIRLFTKTFKQEFNVLHVLINNAGVMFCPYMKTEDGFEMQIGVNHFGHFALTNLLMDILVWSSPSRVINVSSLAHTFPGTRIKLEDINSELSYNPISAYSQSKLANILFTKELHRKLSESGVTSYALHPGCVCTDLYRHVAIIGRIFNSAVGLLVGKTHEQGAQTTIYCAVEEGLEALSGSYFSDCAVKKSSSMSRDEGLAKNLWELSERLTGVKYPLD